MRVENDLLHEASQRELSNEEYSQLYVFLSNTPAQYIRDSIASSDLIKIISYIDVDENEQGEGLIKLLFPLFSVDFIRESSDIIVEIFSGECRRLTLFLNETCNLIKYNTNGTDILFGDDVLLKLIELVYHSDTNISQSAKKLIYAYTSQNDDISETFISRFHSFNYLPSSSNNLNYLEVVINTSQKQTSVNHRMSFPGVFFNRMKIELDSEDILSVINILEILKSMNNKQIKALVENKLEIFDLIYIKFLHAENQHLFDGIVEASLSFFGKLMELYPNLILDKYGNFMTLLENRITSNNNLVSCIHSMEIIAQCSSNSNCKLLLDSRYGSTISTIISKMAQILSNSTVDNKNRIINALCHMLVNNDSSDQISQITRKWFHELSERLNMRRLIIQSIRSPFEEVRLSGLQFLNSISCQIWGLEWICECQFDNIKLLDLLLTRNDGYKSCIDLKFELLLQLLTNLTALHAKHGDNRLEVCSSQQMDAIKLYCNQGKYYGSTQDNGENVLIDTMEM